MGFTINPRLIDFSLRIKKTKSYRLNRCLKHKTLLVISYVLPIQKMCRLVGMSSLIECRQGLKMANRLCLKINSKDNKYRPIFCRLVKFIGYKLGLSLTLTISYKLEFKKQGKMSTGL